MGHPFLDLSFLVDDFETDFSDAPSDCTSDFVSVLVSVSETDRLFLVGDCPGDEFALLAVLELSAVPELVVFEVGVDTCGKSPPFSNIHETSFSESSTS